MTDYALIQKCVTRTKGEHVDVSRKEVDEICDEYIINHFGPAVFLLIDLTRRTPTVKIEDLTSLQKSDYEYYLKTTKRQRLPKGKKYDPDFDFTRSVWSLDVIPIMKFWKWWEIKKGKGELETVNRIGFYRNIEKKTEVSLVLASPEGVSPGRKGLEGTIIMTNTRANNLLRYLTQEGIVFL